jgi:AcrR family transcriptional regulator
MRQKQKADASREDPRVRRTRKLLQDALVELMADRSFESITIGDITETAMVNHATFYRHYRDKYHLAEAIFTAAIESIPVDESKPDSSDFQLAWVTLFKHIEKNDRLYRTMLGSGNTSFFRRIREYIASMAKKSAETRIILKQPIGGTLGITKIPDTDFAFIFVANLLIGNITWWLEDGRQYSSDQIVEWTRKFLRKGFGGLLRD